ncbi:MAG TPA: YaiO family outer membrane beta-barrel protein [Candidatus Baltobacteraceae bacterium]|jgi:YaiO family outer membrane protein
MLVAALLLAQVTQGTPVFPLATPAPSPSPGASRRPAIVDVDAGGSNSYLNNGKGRWETGYFGTSYRAPSGFGVHVDALNEVRFGTSTDVYAAGVDVPTGHPNGTLHLGYGVSSRNEVIPSKAILAGYDLRTGGGWSYQFGYVGRDFSSASAANYGVGTDKHWDHQALGYFLNFSTVSSKTGLGIVQGLRWSDFLPLDTVTLTADAGRGAENTGRARVAIHDVVGFDADEVHWLDPHTAVRLDAGYFSVARAYQRFLVLVGLRVRMGRLF